MSDLVVAKRYAVALFQLAKEKNLLDQMEEELRVVREVVSENAELNSILKSPKVSKDKKQQLIQSSFSSLTPYVINTLLILIDRHREDHIAQVASDFIELADNEKGVAEATVTSVRPLTEEESKELSAAFAAKLGKKSLRIQNIVDSNLLGGLKLRVGNRIYDGSLQGKLERLERQLLR